MGDFYNGSLWGNVLSFDGSSWNFVPGYIKNVDTHHENDKWKCVPGYLKNVDTHHESFSSK